MIHFAAKALSSLRRVYSILPGENCGLFDVPSVRAVLETSGRKKLGMFIGCRHKPEKQHGILYGKGADFAVITRENISQTLHITCFLACYCRHFSSSASSFLFLSLSLNYIPFSDVRNKSISKWP